MSTLMFWNKQSNNNGANTQNGEQKSGKKNWLHTPDVLVNGHVAYPVKFLGSTAVDQPKGIEVVKEAIRRLQFSQQMKKAESGNNVKTKKVEITVSINGVAIQKQENKAQVILHQFPLHKISYCADEKGAKKFFSFIAKTGPQSLTNGSTLTNGNSTTTIANDVNENEGHECFVFISNKLASDITLTIGQAFDLAYRRYINESSKGIGNGSATTDVSKLQLQNKYLENALVTYRQRLKEISDAMSKSELEKLLTKYGVKDICEMPQVEMNGGGLDDMSVMNGNKTPDSGIEINSSNNDDQMLIETGAGNNKNSFVPSVPPRNFQNQLNSTFEAMKPSVGTKLEGLLLHSDSDSDFDPRACESEIIMNGNSSVTNGGSMNDMFGFEPPKTPGQQLFNFSPTNGSAVLNGNGSVHGSPSSPPPLLAPPPKVAAPRRTTPATNNNKINQDLFGSAPFSPFDESDHNTVVNAPPQSSMSVGLNFSHESHDAFRVHEPVITKVPMPNPFKEQSSGHPVPTINILGNETGHSIANPVLYEINALSHNIDKLDNLLANSNASATTTSPPSSHNLALSHHMAIITSNGDNDSLLPPSSTSATSSLAATSSSVAKKLNPFAKTIARSKSPTLNEIKKKDPNDVNSVTGSGQAPVEKSPSKSSSIPNPFSRSESFLNRNQKYDAFKNAIEFEQFSMAPSPVNDGKSENMHFNGGGSIISESDTAKFFNGHSPSRFNEFSNRLIDSATASLKKNSFTTTPATTNGFDDFSLESLDPLRK